MKSYESLMEVRKGADVQIALFYIGKAAKDSSKNLVAGSIRNFSQESYNSEKIVIYCRANDWNS